MTMFVQNQDMCLRLTVNKQLVAWTSDESIKDSYFFFKRVLGKRQDKSLESQFTDEDRHICQMLVGPYGHSVFKMLCIRRNINTSK